MTKTPNPERQDVELFEIAHLDYDEETGYFPMMNRKVYKGSLRGAEEAAWQSLYGTTACGATIFRCFLDNGVWKREVAHSFIGAPLEDPEFED